MDEKDGEFITMLRRRVAAVTGMSLETAEPLQIGDCLRDLRSWL